MAEKQNKVQNMDESKSQLLENEQKIQKADGALGEKVTEIPQVSSGDLAKDECEGSAPEHGNGKGQQDQESESVTVDKQNPHDGRAKTVCKNTG